MALLKSLLLTFWKHLLLWLLPPLTPGNEEHERLSWLVLLRWLAVAGQLLAISVAWRLQFVSAAQGPVLLGLCGALALYNLGANRSLWRERALLSPQSALLAGLLVDWVQFIALMSLTQGIHNPFYPLIYVHAVLGAVLLPLRTGTALLVVMAVSLYLLNPVVYVFNDQQTYVRLSALVAWGIQLSVLISVWGLAAWISRRMLGWRHQAEVLRERQQRLQRVHLLGALGAGVAHEFATPLNTLRLRLQRLERSQPEHPDLQAGLRALAQCESRLRSLAALPSADDLRHMKPIQLTPYVQNQVQQWRRRWPACELEIHSSLPPDFEIHLPEMVLRQALSNLLDNAAQAMQGQGAMALMVSLQTEHGAPGLAFSVQDQGPGWPESVLAHLGEPFITTRPEGTGLGLYTVYMLAQSLGGQLTLRKSAAYSGAEAYVWLPLTPR